MAGALNLRIITPDKIVLDTTADSIRIPGVDGSIGILPRHSGMVAALDAGELSFIVNGQREHFFVAGGFAEVSGDTVRVVSDAAERPTDIDVERAVKAAERAKDRLRTQKTNIDSLRANAALRRALIRKKISRYGN